jgi:hypothetical protein
MEPPLRPSSPGFFLTLLLSPSLPPYVDPECQFTWPDTHCLPQDAGFYAVSQDGDVWTVRSKLTGLVEYTGPGPVELVPAPAPF